MATSLITKQKCLTLWASMFALLIVVLLVPMRSIAETDNADGKNDPTSGLVIKPGFETVRAHCTACHSAKLVTQNHMSRERWLSTIRWMQKTQNLWPLPKEEQILDYLSANYGERTTGRRAPLPANLMPAKQVK